MVRNIREQISNHYNVSLGPEYKGREITRKQVTNLVDKQANTKIKELFGEGYTFHDARAIYAQLAYIQHAPPSLSQTYYYSQVLGHAENSLTTALSYQKFSIRRKLKEDDPDLVGQITTLQEEFRTLKQQPRPLPDVVVPNDEVLYFEDNKGETFSLKKQSHLRVGNDIDR
jgi:hypothetical protein